MRSGIRRLIALTFIAIALMLLARTSDLVRRSWRTHQQGRSVESARPALMNSSHVLDPALYAPLPAEPPCQGSGSTASVVLLIVVATDCPECPKAIKQWLRLLEGPASSSVHLLLAWRERPYSLAMRERLKPACPAEVVIRDIDVFRARTGITAIPFAVLVSNEGKLHAAVSGVPTDEALDPIRIAVSAGRFPSTPLLYRGGGTVPLVFRP